MNWEWWRRIEREAEEDTWAQRRSIPIEPDRWRNLHDGFTRTYRIPGIGITESMIEALLAESIKAPAAKCGYEVIPQYPIDNFRYDFAIKNQATGKVVAVVECDGAAFHCTPEQIANDRAKDATAEANGLMIVRVGGRDICQNAKHCAESVIFEVYPL